MKTGLGNGVRLLSLAGICLMGCKTPPFCEPLGACGGDLLAGQTDKINMDGLIDREWAVTNINGAHGSCNDQLETPPVPLSLVRQPPVQATDRPPDKVTADWCSNLVFKPDGEVGQFIVWAPAIPLKVGRLIMSGDPDSAFRGTYSMQITFEKTFSLTLSESCLTAQGLRLTCPVVGRQIGKFLAPEANIYSVRCYDPPKGEGGCQCEYDLSFIGGPNGRWYTGAKSATINFFDDSFAPPATSDYCLKADGSLDLTGHDFTTLFNEKSMRTMRFLPPSCTDGVRSLSLGETGIDCGGPTCPPCGTCSDGVKSGDETGIDCGGSCLGVLCDPDPADPTMVKGACVDGKKEKWEEGLDCGGPCPTECP
jgi:hypothetical protein